MQFRQLSEHEVNKLHEIAAKYNALNTIPGKQFYYGFLLGFTEGTDYTFGFDSSQGLHIIRIFDIISENISGYSIGGKV